MGERTPRTSCCRCWEETETNPTFLPHPQRTPDGWLWSFQHHHLLLVHVRRQLSPWTTDVTGFCSKCPCRRTAPPRQKRSHSRHCSPPPAAVVVAPPHHPAAAGDQATTHGRTGLAHHHRDQPWQRVGWAAPGRAWPRSARQDRQRCRHSRYFLLEHFDLIPPSICVADGG